MFLLYFSLFVLYILEYTCWSFTVVIHSPNSSQPSMSLCPYVPENPARESYQILDNYTSIDKMKRPQSPDPELKQSRSSSQDAEDQAQEASSRLTEDHKKANAKTLQAPFQDTRVSHPCYMQDRADRDCHEAWPWPWP